MREPTLVHPILMSQRKVDIAKQEQVSRYPGIMGLERIRPSLALSRPWVNKLLQTGRFNVPWYIMRPPDMIHAILWRAIPHCAPGHRAPPQLGYLATWRYMSHLIHLLQYEQFPGWVLRKRYLAAACIVSRSCCSHTI